MRRLLTLALTLTAVAAAACVHVAAAAAEAPCWTAPESKAIAVRVLQSELTVGALACGLPDAYRTFVESQQPALQRYGAVLTGYYARAYGEVAGERRLDAFVTRLANEASTRKADWPNGYCAFVRALTERAAVIPPETLGDFAAVHPYARKTAAAGLCPGGRNR